MAKNEPIATGNTAMIYISGDSITKVYKTADWASVEVEASNQRLVHALGLPVPAVIKVTAVDGKPALVMERIDGHTMFDAIGDNWDRLPYHMAQSVEIQRAMHSLAGNGLVSMKTRLEYQILHATQISPEQKATMIARLDCIPPAARVCHGDFHFQNLIVNGDTVTIIDWMDATSGDPRLDVCRSYMLYDSVSSEASEMYLQEYCKQTGQSADEILAWLPVIAAARLSETIGIEEVNRLTRMVDRA